jgi:hypothetical protein
VSEPKFKEKPFDISKREVWEAYQKVKANLDSRRAGLTRF